MYPFKCGKFTGSRFLQHFRCSKEVPTRALITKYRLDKSQQPDGG